MRSRAARPAAILAAAGVAAAGVVAVAGAGSGASDSGVRGRVVPCGLIHERAAPCAGSPAGAKVIVRHASGGAAVATATADAQGRFRIAVAAGAYRVEVRASSGSRRRAAAVVPAVVPRHGWVTVVLPAGRMAPGGARLGAS